MKVPIIYEDNDLLAIDKPAGVVVNRSENVDKETIQDWAQERLKIDDLELRSNKEGQDFKSRAGIVHRLDKETSGILLIAKNPQVFYQLQLQFQNRTVVKKYLALVHGKVTPTEGKVCAPTGRLPWNRRKFGIIASGRAAETAYKVLSYYQFAGKNYTLVEATPHTGRTHQIRIHLKYLGYPIVSDELYAGKKNYREDMKLLPRLFLHAAYLMFQHPQSQKNLVINCKLPTSLEEVVNKMSKT